MSLLCRSRRFRRSNLRARRHEGASCSFDSVGRPAHPRGSNASSSSSSSLLSQSRLSISVVVSGCRGSLSDRCCFGAKKYNIWAGFHIAKMLHRLRTKSNGIRGIVFFKFWLNTDSHTHAAELTSTTVTSMEHDTAHAIEKKSDQVSLHS